MAARNKTILITGASRGIGHALARAALEQGWNVIATARRAGDEKLAALKAAYPGSLRTEELEVTDAESVARLGRALAEEAVDVLVNNAGVMGPEKQSALDMDFGGFARALEVNTLAPLRVSQALLPALRRAGGAKVVNISSIMGSLSLAKPDHIAYRASKAALNMVMRGLAADLAPENIAVFLVHPGWVRTDMGGPNADIDVKTSAEGILKAVAARGVGETGTFFDYRGEAISW